MRGLQPWPRGSGSDFAGIVTAVGENVSSIRVGADVIKFATTGGASSRSGHGPKDIAFGPDEVKALVDEARSQEKFTMCHAVGGPGLRMCIEAGVGSVDRSGSGDWAGGRTGWGRRLVGCADGGFRWWLQGRGGPE